MKNWEKKNLSEICAFVRGPFGGSLKKNIFKKNGYAVYEQQHAIYDQFDDVRYFIDEIKFNEMKRFELNPGDLIMSCSGTMGKIAIVPENIKQGIINQALLKLTPSNKVSTIFLKLWMQSESFQESLKEYSGGAAIQNVASVAILKQIPIPLPPLPEQQRIVSILDEAFASIDKAKANAEKNLQNAKDLFDSYLQGVFENKGEGWEEMRLGEVCNVIGGGTPSKANSKFYAGDVFWATVRDMKGDMISDTEHKITMDAVKNSSTNIIPKGNVVIATRVGLGKVCLIKNDTAINQDLRGVVPINSTKLAVDFLFRWFKSISYKIVGEGTGATVQGVKLPFIKSLSIVIPPIKTQQRIVQKLNTLQMKTQKLESLYDQKINDLEELKKCVLKKAFSGELALNHKPLLHD